MTLKLISTVSGIAGLAWLVLLFSSRAILVGERVEKATLHERLVCDYFTGTHRLRKEYLHSRSDGFIGRAACPRWETVRPVAAR